MIWKLKTKRSAGIPVTKRVHALLRTANNARDAGAWDVAARHFEQALSKDPSLYHIWMQFGHAAKRNGEFTGAEAAYRAAADREPERGEPHLHLGHLYKVMGRRSSAGEAYFRAVQLDPANPDAVMELHRQIAQATGAMRGEMLDLLRRAGPPPSSDLPGSAMSEESGSKRVHTYFDVSDLVGYYGQARLPTGIQRVQIETITQAFATGAGDFRICCVFEGRDEWIEVPARQFVDLVQLSLQGNDREDPAWLEALNRLYIVLALAEPMRFPSGACLVNLGTSWWLQNYFLHVRNAQIAHGIKYVPLIFDLIPVLMPEHCINGLVENFITWLVGVFDHAAGYLAISEATKADLLRVAADLGYNLDPASIEVVRLDADFRKPTSRLLGARDLAKWGLEDGRFVLFVSTIESRKGHQVAFDAWQEMIARSGRNGVPRLVCVGGRGWLNDRVYRMLAEDPELASHVTMLSGISDDELALLYRSCLVTIYPSLYEGWGLPITEALCYGKAVIASDNSSLPEAGGPFGIYVQTGSSGRLAREVERMSLDAPYRQAIEQRIAAEFHPRTWRDVAAQIRHSVSRLASDADGAAYRPPVAAVGAYHPIGRVAQSRVWPGLRSGEIFRTGTGWLWPEPWGCWAQPEGGNLAIGTTPDQGGLRIYLHIQAPPGEACHWRLTVEDGPEMRGILPAGEQRWLAFDCATSDGRGAIRLRLCAEPSQVVAMKRGDFDVEALVSIAARGFLAHKSGDTAARMAFLEAVTLNAVDDLSAYRESATPLAKG
jgi:glycosyltransferase involved in cell wall biosynthesis